MYKYHEQFYWGYGRMYILINIVLAKTISLFLTMLFSYMTTDCEVNIYDSEAQRF